MIKKILAAGILAGFALAAQAHFGMVIPNHAMVVDQAQADLKLDVAFAHPMERNGMTMVKPAAMEVFVDGKKQDLLGKLVEEKFFGKEAWRLDYKITRPGVYQFAVEPKPYWEPAEDKFIVHYTKVIVPAFGDDEGWDEPTGIKAEIVPLTRPWGNYAGNTFQGQVLFEGKPVPNADVEIEYYNKAGDKETPNDYYSPQVVKTDPNGIFTYTAPWAGWWGFSAINEAPFKIKHDGEEKDVEIGAVLWTQFGGK